MTVESGGGSKGLVGRALGIITKPKDEWAIIDGEAATTQSLFTGYVMILAAIPAVMSIVAGLLFSSMMAGAFGAMGMSAGLPVMWTIVSAVLSYVVSLVIVFIMAIIINALAASFGAVQNNIQAMKVAAYSMTAVWVASIANIVPILGWLVVLAAAIWTIFILHWGLVACMKPPADKAVGYSAVVIILGVVISFVLSMIVGAIIGMFAFGSMMATGGSLYGM